MLSSQRINLAEAPTALMLLNREQRDAILALYPSEAQNYILLLESFSGFLEREIFPNAAKIDSEGTFPKENLDRLFKQCFAGMALPSRYGGMDLPYPIYIMAMELLGMSCASTGISAAIHGTACSGIEKFGSEAQKERFLRPMITGEKLGAFALTEPHSGSDAGSLETKAELKGGEYVLNGSKIFISNGGKADVYIVFAASEKGPCAFIVENGTKGLSFGKNIPKLGVRGSTLTEVFFEGCSLPEASLLGREGEGFEYAKWMLHGGRITVAALSVGIAQMAFERTLEYAKGRRTFGKPLSKHQMIRQKLADMSTAISAARQLTYRAAWVKEMGRDCALEAAQAKLFASEMALKVCDDAIQIHGGYGYTDDLDVHRHWRDARLMTIGEGTSEMMRLVISHRLAEGGPL